MKPRLAVLLIAGGGIRLAPHTRTVPKCMVKVAGEPLLVRMLGHLSRSGVNRCVLVVGHQWKTIEEAVGESWRHMEIDYVRNPDWQATNNVVSLALAEDRIKEDFLLLEGDLIFSYRAFRKMLGPDRMAVDRFESHMDGTVVTLESDVRVKRFYLPSSPGRPAESERIYKTVNIYSFRAATYLDQVAPRLRDLLKEGKTQVYYEQAIAEAVEDGDLILSPVSFEGTPWYEIDTEDDLRKAEALFNGVE